MKSRSGFVSNSSSTSFVVGVEDNTEIELHLKVDLATFGDVLTTEQEVTDYFTEHWDKEELLDTDLPYKSWYEQALNAVRRGSKVVAGSLCDDGSEALETMLCLNGIPETPGIEIIHTEAGY